MGESPVPQGQMPARSSFAEATEKVPPHHLIRITVLSPIHIQIRSSLSLSDTQAHKDSLGKIQVEGPRNHNESHREEIGRKDAKKR